MLLGTLECEVSLDVTMCYSDRVTWFSLKAEENGAPWHISFKKVLFCFSYLIYLWILQNSKKFLKFILEFVTSP